jgi:hypothetical protein
MKRKRRAGSPPTLGIFRNSEYRVILYAKNQGAFLMRGLEKVRAEFSLTALAYNMTRVLAIVGIERLLKVFKNAKNRAFFVSLFVFC